MLRSARLLIAGLLLTGAVLVPASAHAALPWTEPTALVNSPVAPGATVLLTDDNGSAHGVYGDATGAHFLSRSFRAPGAAPLTFGDGPAEHVYHSSGNEGMNTIVWVDETGADGKQLWAVKADGGSFQGFGAPQRISQGSNPVSKVSYASAFDGSTAVTWLQMAGGRPQVFVAWITKNGTWQGPTQLSGAVAITNDVFEPAVSIAGGMPTVAWSQGDAGAGGAQHKWVNVRRPNGSGGFATLETLSADGADATEPVITPAGLPTVAWVRDGVVQQRTFNSGAWQPVQNLSGAGLADEPATAGNGSSEQLITWTEKDGANLARLRVATRNDGSPNFAVADGFLSPATQEIAHPRASVDVLGAATIAYRSVGGIAAVRRAGKADPFTPEDFLTQAAAADEAPSVHSVANGTAVVAWRSASLKLFAAGLDGGAPHIFGLSVPPTATAGQEIAVSVTPIENWSEPTVKWEFGDGTTAFGSTAKHTYVAGGDYTVKLTVSDGNGNARSFTRTTKVAPQKQEIVTPPPPQNQGPQTRIASMKKKIKAKKLKAFKGTASDDRGVARVQIALVKLEGRGVKAAAARKRRCRQLKNPRARFSSVKLDARRRCTPTRFLTSKGTSSWSYKLKKRLPAGSYVIYARATDSDGATHTTRRAFRVVR